MTVGDLEGLGRTLDALTALGGARADGPGAGRTLAIEIEVETGLGRGGFASADVVEAAGRIEASPVASLTGLWTHLQASEDPARTAEQLARFERVTADLRGIGIEPASRHVAASAGLLPTVPAFDGVRPGLAIYGLAAG